MEDKYSVLDIALAEAKKWLNEITVDIFRKLLS